jgi:hypothetical protein
LASVKGNF